jgi:hypothetical protein
MNDGRVVQTPDDASGIVWAFVTALELDSSLKYRFVSLFYPLNQFSRLTTIHWIQRAKFRLKRPGLSKVEFQSTAGWFELGFLRNWISIYYRMIRSG